MECPNKVVFVGKNGMLYVFDGKKKPALLKPRKRNEGK
jgi:hypothetical protein